MTEETNKPIEPTASQVACCSCGGNKIQLILITRSKDYSQLDLLCDNCGRLQVLGLAGGLDIEETKPLNTIKPKNSYLG